MEIREDNLEEQPDAMELGRITVGLLSINPQKCDWFLQSLAEEILDANSSGLTQRDKKQNFAKKFQPGLALQTHFFGIIGFYIKTTFLKFQKNKKDTSLKDFCQLLVDKLLQKENEEEMRKAVRKILDDTASESATIGRGIKDNIDRIALGSGEKLQAVIDGRVRPISTQKFSRLSPLGGAKIKNEIFKDFSLMPYLTFMQAIRSGRSGLTALMDLLNPKGDLQPLFDAKLDVKEKTEMMRNYVELMNIVSVVAKLPIFMEKTELDPNFLFGNFAKRKNNVGEGYVGSSLIRLINFLLIVDVNSAQLNGLKWGNNGESNLAIIGKLSKSLQLPSLSDVMTDFALLKKVDGPNNSFNERFKEVDSLKRQQILAAVRAKLDNNYDTRAIAEMMGQEEVKVFFLSGKSMGVGDSDCGYFDLVTSTGQTITVNFEIKDSKVETVGVELLQPYGKSINIDSTKFSISNVKNENGTGDLEILNQGNHRLLYFCKVLRRKLAEKMQLLAKIFPNVDLESLIDLAGIGFWLMQNEVEANSRVESSVRSRQTNNLMMYNHLFWNREIDGQVTEDKSVDAKSIVRIVGDADAPMEKPLEFHFLEQMKSMMSLTSFPFRLSLDIVLNKESGENLNVADLVCLYLKGEYGDLMEKMRSFMLTEDFKAALPKVDELTSIFLKKISENRLESLTEMLAKEDFTLDLARQIVGKMSGLDTNTAKKMLDGKEAIQALKEKIVKLIAFLNQSKYSKNVGIISLADFEIIKLLAKLNVAVNSHFRKLSLKSDDYGQLDANKVLYIVDEIQEEISDDKIVNLFYNFWKERSEGKVDKYYGSKGDLLLYAVHVYFDGGWHEKIMEKLVDETAREKYLKCLGEAMEVFSKRIELSKTVIEPHFRVYSLVANGISKAGIVNSKLLEVMVSFDAEAMVGFSRKFNMPDKPLLQALVNGLAHDCGAKFAKLFGLFPKQDVLETMAELEGEVSWDSIFGQIFTESNNVLNKIGEQSLDEIKENLKEIGLFLEVIKKLDLPVAKSENFIKLSDKLWNIVKADYRLAYMVEKVTVKTEKNIQNDVDAAISKVNKKKVVMHFFNGPLEGKWGETSIPVEPEIPIEQQKVLIEKQILTFLDYLGAIKILSKIKTGEPLNGNDDLSNKNSGEFKKNLVCDQLLDVNGRFALLEWVKGMSSKNSLWSDEHRRLLFIVLSRWASEYKDVGFMLEMAAVSPMAAKKLEVLNLDDLRLFINLLMQLGVFENKVLMQGGDDDLVVSKPIAGETARNLLSSLSRIDKDAFDTIMNLPLNMVKLLAIRREMKMPSK